MTDQELLGRIVTDPAIMVGKPTIRGTRLTVDFILNLLAHGSTAEEILAEYRDLKREDLQACLLYGARASTEVSFFPLTASTENV